MSEKTITKSLLRIHQVLDRIPIGESSWWKGCKEGIYPKPIKLGPRTTVWRAEEIKEFIERVSGQQQGEVGNE